MPAAPRRLLNCDTVNLYRLGMTPRVQEFSFHYPSVDRQLLKLGCYLTSIGELRYPPNVKYPVPGHPELYKINWEKGRSSLTDFALVLITTGEGQFET
jgi:hypothetical protein